MSKRGPLLDPRPNPLQEYIQDTWVNGSATATGGSNYPHIKLYGHNYWSLDANAANFVATHFDMYTGGGTAVGTASTSLNPDMLFLWEAANIPSVRPTWESDMANEWVGNTAADTCIHGNPRPGSSAQGYGWDDILLLYKYNTSTDASTKQGLPYFGGWNPADDTDGDGCIEPNEGNNGLPSDPNRSAQDYWDARVQIDVGPVGQPKYWWLHNVANPGCIAFNAHKTVHVANNYGAEGFHFDVAAYQPNPVYPLGFENTFQYEGLDELALDFPYQEDKIAFVPSVMEIAEAELGEGPKVALANMVTTGYTCAGLQMQHDAALAYLENDFLETWLYTNVAHAYQAAHSSERGRYLECPYSEYLSAGKGQVFTCYDPLGSARGKLFSLGMFYLINHQMAFYYYRTAGHATTDPQSTQWNPWVEYDVGQPMVNNLELEDFEGNTDTDKFFVFETGATYEILGRQFLRSDGKKILVLVKLMADGQSEGSGSASHSLGNYYRQLKSDFTFEQASNTVTMTNNSAVILWRKNPPGCHGCEPDF